MKTYIYAAAALLAPTIAAAQTAPAPAPAAAPAAGTPTAGAGVTVGATVYDTAGATVGRVASTDGTNAVIDTGTVKAAVPLTSLATGAKGPTLGLTKMQLEAAAGQQQQASNAEFQSKLVAGAEVYGTGGTKLGTIKSTSGSNIVLTTPQGDASLPASGFGPGPQGVTLGLTADQLRAAMGGAAGAASSTTSTTTTTADPAAGTATTTTESATTATDGTTATTTETKKTRTKPRN